MWPSRIHSLVDVRERTYVVGMHTQTYTRAIDIIKILCLHNFTYTLTVAELQGLCKLGVQLLTSHTHWTCCLVTSNNMWSCGSILLHNLYVEISLLIPTYICSNGCDTHAQYQIAPTNNLHVHSDIIHVQWKALESKCSHFELGTELTYTMVRRLCVNLHV